MMFSCCVVCSFLVFLCRFCWGDRDTDSLAHIVYAGNSAHLPGLRASARSVIMNSAHPSKIVIHIFELNSSPMELEELGTWMLAKNSLMQRHQYTIDEVIPYINVHLNSTSRLKSPSNYVRYLLAEKLKDISMCLYLDTDTIVTKDVVPFMRERSSNKVLSAFPRSTQTVSAAAFSKLKNLKVDVAQPNPSFNAGIVVFNLNAWRQQNMTAKAKLVSKYNVENKLWDSYGSQPAMLVLLGGDRFERLQENLFVNDIAYRELGSQHLSQIDVDQAMFLHWNGGRKPWNPCAGKKPCFNFDIWKRYDVAT